MATQTALTEAEYLRTSFEEPEPEYVDGELIERALPNNPHSRTQHRLSVIFGRLEDRVVLHCRPELRVRVKPGRYRVADLVVYTEFPEGNIPPQVPFIVVEIISPDDRWEHLLSKLEDYAAWGVRHVWAVDPALNTCYVYANRSITAVESFDIPEWRETISASAILN